MLESEIGVDSVVSAPLAINAHTTTNNRGYSIRHMDSFVPVQPRERLGADTPMRCPICDGALSNTQIRDLGGVTADLVWQLHAGECEEHGWFQAEVISRPPREIFPVTRPFGVARRLVIDGDEIFAFPTIWNDAPPEVIRSRVDPLDAKFWQVRRQAGAS